MDYPIDIQKISSFKKNIYIDVLLCLENDLNNSIKRNHYDELSEDDIKDLIHNKFTSLSGGSFKRQRTIKVIRKY